MSLVDELVMAGVFVGYMAAILTALLIVGAVLLAILHRLRVLPRWMLAILDEEAAGAPPVRRGPPPAPIAGCGLCRLAQEAGDAVLRRHHLADHDSAARS